MQPGLAVATIVAPVVAHGLHLRFEKLERHLGLGERVDAGAAAAAVGVRHLDEAGGRGSDARMSARRLADALRVREVAGVLVGDRGARGGAVGASNGSSTRNSLTSFTCAAKRVRSLGVLRVAAQAARRTPSSQRRSRRS